MDHLPCGERFVFGTLALFLWVGDAKPNRLWGVWKQVSGAAVQTSLSKNANILSS